MSDNEKRKEMAEEGVSYAFTAVVPGIAQLQNVWGNRRYIKRLCGDIVEDCSKTPEGETK